jgi:hypothetical protein
MRTLILALALVLSPAFAGQRMLQGDSGTILRLYDTPCLHGGTLGQLKPEWREKFQRAEFTQGKLRVYACWIDAEDGDVYVQIEDGNFMVLPAASFRDEPGA